MPVVYCLIAPTVLCCEQCFRLDLMTVCEKMLDRGVDPHQFMPQTVD